MTILAILLITMAVARPRIRLDYEASPVQPLRESCAGDGKEPKKSPGIMSGSNRMAALPSGAGPVGTRAAFSSAAAG